MVGKRQSTTRGCASRRIGRMDHLAELKSWRDSPNVRKECRDICGWAVAEIERLQDELAAKEIELNAAAEAVIYWRNKVQADMSAMQYDLDAARGEPR